MKIKSVLEKKVNIKVIVHSAIHEEAFHGPCRFSDLSGLTMEAEKEVLNEELQLLKDFLSQQDFPSYMNMLEPEKMNLWIEKENPEIMLEEAQLKKLEKDSEQVDLYVVIGGLIQYTCLKIGERFKKPVASIFKSYRGLVNGWDVDMPAGLRVHGLEGYFLPDWKELNQLAKALYVRKCIANTKVLSLTESFGKLPKGVISDITDFNYLNEHYGVEFHHVGYREFFAQMDTIEKDPIISEECKTLTKHLCDKALWNEMAEVDVLHSVVFYKTVQHFMDLYQCNAFTTECFEMCSSMIPWKKRFTPCLTHSLLKDQGFPSACENDINALMAMMVEMFIQGKAVKMGNPVIDIAKGTLTVYHDVSSLKMHGFDQPDLEYGIQAFTESRFGATLRYDFSKDLNQVMTAARFDASGKKILVTKGRVLESVDYRKVGCAEGVMLKINNPQKFWDEQCNFGHHLAVVFGDAIEDIQYCAKIIGFETVFVE